MKILYIIAGGILVIVAVVFLAPQKQNNTEEKASIPLDEIDAAILEQFRADLTPEEKELGPPRRRRPTRPRKIRDAQVRLHSHS